MVKPTVLAGGCARGIRQAAARERAVRSSKRFAERRLVRGRSPRDLAGDAVAVESPAGLLASGRNATPRCGRDSPETTPVAGIERRSSIGMANERNPQPRIRSNESSRFNDFSFHRYEFSC
jgi:hypothetical protein